MQKFISAVLSGTFAFAFMFHSAQWYNSVTGIVDRPASELEAQIVDNYTDDYTGSLDEIGVEKSRKNVQKLISCVKAKETCKGSVK